MKCLIYIIQPLLLAACFMASCSEGRIVTSRIENGSVVLSADSTLHDTVFLDLSGHWDEYDTYAFQDLGTEKYGNGKYHRVGEVLLCINTGTTDTIVSAYKEVTFYPIIRRDYLDEAEADYIVLPHLGYAIHEALPVDKGLVGYPDGEAYTLTPVHWHFADIPRRNVVKSAKEACRDSRYKHVWRRYAMSYRRGDFLKDGMFTYFPLYYKIILNCKNADGRTYQRSIAYTEHPAVFKP